jgi:hypothetical protein
MWGLEEMGAVGAYTCGYSQQRKTSGVNKRHFFFDTSTSHALVSQPLSCDLRGLATSDGNSGIPSYSFASAIVHNLDPELHPLIDIC